MAKGLVVGEMVHALFYPGIERWGKIVEISKDWKEIYVEVEPGVVWMTFPVLCDQY
jgi:hypothetical protein